MSEKQKAIRKAPLQLTFYPNPVLREKCKPYRDEQFGEQLQQFADKMLETMYVEGGVGLAAPQVGHEQCIVVLDASEERDGTQGQALVNPVIEESRGSMVGVERCLSLPHPMLEGKVKRAEWVRVRYRTPQGNEKVIEATELLARVLQHEIDHLHGVLFTDRLSSLKKMTIRKYLKESEDQYG